MPESERLLAGILADHFFVEVIWVPVWRVLEGKRGSVLEVCGSRENLELAEYVHAFVSETGERLFREYRRQSGRRLARDRHRFLAGLVAGFRERLEREGQKNREQGCLERRWRAPRLFPAPAPACALDAARLAYRR